MKKNELLDHLSTMENLVFLLPDGTSVPAHFHLTEAGLVTRHFVDCGGTVRTERAMSLQLWVAHDVAHRLSPQKLKDIINKSEPILGNEDLDVEVEYQGATIGRYGLEWRDGTFRLLPTHTDCRASDKCGIPEKPRLQLADLGPVRQKENACCTPGGGCC